MIYYKSLGRSPVPALTMVMAVCIYGIALPIIGSNPTSRSTQISACIWIWLFSIVYLVFIARWVLYALSSRSTKTSVQQMLYAFFDVLFSHYHVLGALAFSLWLMDTSVGKDAYFSGIPVANLASPYSVYVGDFLLFVCY